MSAMLESAVTAAAPVVPVVHFIKGQVLRGSDCEFRLASGLRFATPKLDIDSLTWSRRQQGPAFDLPSAEIIDLLVATGERMARDPDGFMAEALENMARTCTLERRIVDNLYRDLPRMLTNRASMLFTLQQELGGTDVLDGWRAVMRPNGRLCRIRAYPPRLIHVLAGNTPGVAAGSIITASLTKGVHLLKLPSNDLFTAPAVLRTMAAVAPDHPLVRSFCAVYWRGGDAEVESRICRPQFFDKLVAWGGEAAIRGVKQYAGPGFELVTFDPKTSISFIGREVFESEQKLEEVAELAAVDATPFNQGACVSSRFQFIEGDLDDIDRFCAALQRNLGKERHTASAVCARVPTDLREEIEGLRALEPDYRVWGGCDGAGLVIRSEEPVDFYPDGKIVNVVKVNSLREAVRYANVATSTVGVYPFARKAEVCDELASAGVQRIINLGQAITKGQGVPHDGFWPMNRYMRWITEEE
ncbi:MAG: acyl-CoA reductase [Steroidobacteraceae bacterium]